MAILRALIAIFLTLLLALALVLAPERLLAGESHSGSELHLAVASNFAPVARILARSFENQGKGRLKIRISAGSTGKLFAQI
jgi:ABC-type molybdate transport system substrate-binding protein